VSKTCIQQIWRYRTGTWARISDALAAEETLKIYLDGEFLRALPFLPENHELLVLGYLFNEGLISAHHEVETFTVDLARNEARVTRSRLEARPPFATVLSLMEPVLSPEAVLRLAAVLSEDQLFRETGAVHCGLLARQDSILFSTEDTGRLNLLDKLAGFALKENLAPEELVLVFSGRLTGEAMSRVARMKIPVIVSPAAPTSRGLEIAAAEGITAIGFTRDKRFNVYTHPQRVESG